MSATSPARFSRSQQDIVRDAMFSAAECDTWYTLGELRELTGFPEASISAHMRALRGLGCTLEKRHRAGHEPRGDSYIFQWEYRLTR